MHPNRYKGFTTDEIALIERLGAEVRRNTVQSMLRGLTMMQAMTLEADRTLVEWQVYPRKIRNRADLVGFCDSAVERELAEARRPPPVEPGAQHPPRASWAPARLLGRFLRLFHIGRIIGVVAVGFFLTTGSAGGAKDMEHTVEIGDTKAIISETNGQWHSKVTLWDSPIFQAGPFKTKDEAIDAIQAWIGASGPKK